MTQRLHFIEYRPNFVFVGDYVQVDVIRERAERTPELDGDHRRAGV